MANQIQLMTRKLELLENGSDERRQTETQIKRQQEEFEEFRIVKSRDFLKEESAIYREVYGIVTNAVASYAQAHSIDLVMRHNTENPMNENDPKKLLESMNKQVVYDNNLDITEAIVTAVNDI